MEREMRQVAYETVDVFAEARFGGNPLAVITDARGLTDAEMQCVATEFNYSESTFVLPPQDPANTAHVRIFTPTNEIPFAGHPNVGTAFTLGRLGTVFGKPAGDVMRFEEGAGLVEVEVRRRDGEVDGASIRAPRELQIGAEISPATIAACASLRADDIVTSRHQPLEASVGLQFAFAELRSLESLGRAAPNVTGFNEAALKHPNPRDRFSLFLYARTGENSVRARMFAPLNNILEDPATGSAAAALGGLLASLGRSDAFELSIEQGVEMGRPSYLAVSVKQRDGKRSISVAGRCVPVMRGSLAL
jgi:trans-2,3-dihydro-3-hydroxyanthranilate isomerase